jgi:hypothetical protein
LPVIDVIAGDREVPRSESIDEVVSRATERAANEFFTAIRVEVAVEDEYVNGREE